MDKKAKKRLEVLKKKLESVQRQLAGARKQMDDAAEVKRFEIELLAVQKEIEQLKTE